MNGLIRDNGVGFDMDFYEKLFGVFQRLHGISEYPGHGIGLTFVKAIIDKHGGRIWGESRENEGATFFFTFPPNH
jgi:light-regulated signal transduction histidine kinase (bacteriophytochrome)